MAIEVFCGRAGGATNAAERRVLARVIDLLERHGHDAVILCDFFCDTRQVDLLVATTITTLVLEVKNYSRAIQGDKSSDDWITLETGHTVQNAYRQVHDQMLELKDMLERLTGVNPLYACAVVLFEGGIPAGSMLPPSDHRVEIAGIERLETLLLTPASRSPRRSPWDPGALRDWATATRMARLDHRAMAALPADAARMPPQPAVTARRERVAADVVHVDVTTPSSQSRPRPMLRPFPAAWARRFRLRRALLAVTVVAGAGYIWLHRSQPAMHPVAQSDARPRQHSQRTTVAATHRPAAHRRDVARVDATLARPATVPPATVEPPRPVQPVTSQNDPGPLPPCPEGIDRLGCQPSQESVARLRGQ